LEQTTRQHRLHKPKNTNKRLLSSSRRNNDYNVKKYNNALKSAKKILDLTDTFTVSELRRAYFAAAKMCHPDLQDSTPGDDDLNENFHALTEAYELLQQQHSTTGKLNEYGITAQEEEAFRTVCQDWLGVSAEVVEESKRCPIFRDWLQGKTDAAMYWNSFFALNGGLAPMLRPPAALLDDGGKQEEEKLIKGLNRRKRR